MDTPQERMAMAIVRRAAACAPFSFPVAPGEYDRLLAAAHALALELLASPDAAPMIDADACADQLADDCARDRREPARPDRPAPSPDRRR